MDFAFSPALAEMVATSRTRGRSGRVREGLGALSTPNNLSILRRFLLAEKPVRTLEIGLSFGGSCLVFCASHRDLGRAGEKQHVALDPFQQEAWDDAGLVAIENEKLDAYLDFRSVRSAVALPALWADGAHFDLFRRF